MQHLICATEPRRGESFKAGAHTWDITRVLHHGGTRLYTLEARSRFVQGDYRREFSAEVKD